MDGGKGRPAGRLYVHARSGQVQRARDEGREDVAITRRAAGGRTGRGENGNRPLHAFADVAGVLERLPGTLEKEAMLGIHRAGGGHAHPEERGVEANDVVESATGVKVRGVAYRLDSSARVGPLPLGEDRHRLAASPKVGPELGGASCAGKPTRHPEDGNPRDPPGILLPAHLR